MLDKMNMNISGYYTIYFKIDTILNSINSAKKKKVNAINSSLYYYLSSFKYNPFLPTPNN